MEGPHSADAASDAEAPAAAESPAAAEELAAAQVLPIPKSIIRPPAAGRRRSMSMPVMWNQQSDAPRGGQRSGSGQSASPAGQVLAGPPSSGVLIIEPHRSPVLSEHEVSTQRETDSPVQPAESADLRRGREIPDIAGSFILSYQGHAVQNGSFQADPVPGSGGSGLRRETSLFAADGALPAAAAALAGGPRPPKNAGITKATISAFDEQRSLALRRFRTAVYTHIQANRSTRAFAPQPAVSRRRNHSDIGRDIEVRNKRRKDQLWNLSLFVAASVMLAVELFSFWWIPFRMVFIPEGSAVWQAFELFVDVFQFCSFAANFFIPYNESGIWVTRVFFIARRYVRSPQFPFEALGSLPVGFGCWFLLGGAPWLLALKFARIHNLQDHCQRLVRGLGLWVSPQLQTLCLTGVGYLLVVHLVACGWFLVVKYEDAGPGMGGAMHLTDSPIRDHDNSPFLWYCLGVDWAAKHLCGYGVTGVFPKTDVQFLFMLLVAALGLITYTSMLSVISLHVHTEMTQNAAARLRIKLDDLSDALSALPKDFRDEVRRYYVSVFKVVGTIGMSDVLDDLPPELLEKVRYHIGRAVLMKVPIFAGIRDVNLIDRLTRSLVPKVFLPGMEIVSCGDIGQEMFFVHSGECRIADPQGNTLCLLRSGDHYGEAALLSLVQRTTSVTTLSMCAISVLSRDAFDVVLQDHPDLADIVRSHAPGGDDAADPFNGAAGWISPFGDEVAATTSPRAAGRRRSRVSVSAPFADPFLRPSPRYSTELEAGALQMLDGNLNVSSHLHGDSASIGSFLFGQNKDRRRSTCSSVHSRSSAPGRSSTSPVAPQVGVSFSRPRSIRSKNAARASCSSQFSDGPATRHNRLSVATTFTRPPVEERQLSGFLGSQSGSPKQRETVNVFAMLRQQSGHEYSGGVFPVRENSVVSAVSSRSSDGQQVEGTPTTSPHSRRYSGRPKPELTASFSASFIPQTTAVGANFGAASSSGSAQPSQPSQHAEGLPPSQRAGSSPATPRAEQPAANPLHPPDRGKVPSSPQQQFQIECLPLLTPDRTESAMPPSTSPKDAV
eukprot:TRINITY_DN47570_c0_g1_i1.p1 TRINITY_DN47570_c0_g1~~TRINITY_DN47570_c0_g1_i1.p1  ORF type:complete len:1083 (+),score=252.83 TRINITY_DN47570_c0_g1_i1:66-3251(+)